MNQLASRRLSRPRWQIVQFGIAVLLCILAVCLARAETATVRIGVIGDYGMAGQAEADVANLVNGWNPDSIITLGDNNYENGEAATIDQNIGQYFYPYICPYPGSYGTQAADCVNRFFPTLGNHDWRVPGARPYLDYFTLPGNERYYEQLIGPVHLFALDSDPFEPDGVLPGSTQGVWLQAALQASTAPWKLVYFHHAPYSSGASSTWMRWPFRDWGASAVLAGHYHNYERLVIGGLTYVVNGLGGATIYGSGAPISGSQVKFDKDYGAMLLEADADSMTMKFYTRSGALVDVATLHSGAGTAPTVSFAPATVIGGSSTTGTVLLDSPAPAGGTSVALSSRLPAVLSAPEIVTIAAGALSATFPVQTGATATPVAATLTADFGDVVKNAALTVLPPALSGVTVSPTRSAGGAQVTGTVSLTGAAPAGGLVVDLSSNQGAARVASSVTVPEGAASATFTISSDAVNVDTAAVITATLGGISKTATLTLAPLLKSLSFSPTAVTGGLTTKGTVTLNAPAPAGGTIVSLAGGGPQAIPPGSVAVAAGASSASFTVATSPVASDTSVALTASLQGVTRSASVTVKAPVLSSLSLSPTSVTGGATSTATVALSGPAPADGVTVAMSSGKPQAASIPATLNFPGGSKSASVTVATASVPSDTAVLLTAALNGVSKSATLTVKLPVVASLSPNPVSVTGGSSSKVTVTLNSAAPPGGVTVALSSATPSVASLPASVTVLAGAKTATANVTTLAVASDTAVALTAALSGASRSTTITVKAPVLSTLSVSPTSVTGGGTATTTVTLTGMAPPGGVLLALSSADPSLAALPASVTVPAGAKTATAIVNTVPVTSDTPVALTASMNGVSKSTTVTVKTPVVSSLSVSPTSVTGGGNATATVTLTGVAPTNGAEVALTSANPSVAAIPASVSVVRGAKTATVVLTSVPVPANTPVSLTASLNGVSKSTTVTVKAPVVSSLSVSPTSVTGGGTATATVTLTGDAPSVGAGVALSSDRPDVATAPATVSVVPGTRSASYSVTSTPVVADTTVTLSAALNGVAKSTKLTVKP